MTQPVYRDERCAICKKMKDHPIHKMPPRVGILQRLRSLPWPRFFWGPGEGRHEFRSAAQRVRAAEMMFRLKQRIRRTHRR